MANMAVRFFVNFMVSSFCVIMSKILININQYGFIAIIAFGYHVAATFMTVASVVLSFNRSASSFLCSNNGMVCHNNVVHSVCVVDMENKYTIGTLVIKKSVVKSVVLSVV